MPFQRFPESMDPDDQKDYTFPFKLNPGEEIASALVEVVDETSENVIDDSPIVIVAQSFGQISGSTWGATVWLTAAGAPAGRYYLRCRGETDSSPIPRKFDVTRELKVEQR